MTGKRIDYKTAIACNSCHYYCGSGYLPCAVHPYLQENCPDFRQKEAAIKINTTTYDSPGDVSVSPCGWYRVVPRRHIDSMPVIVELGEFDVYGSA